MFITHPVQPVLIKALWWHDPESEKLLREVGLNSQVTVPTLSVAHTKLQSNHISCLYLHILFIFIS
jgi:hypothetical protein